MGRKIKTTVTSFPHKIVEDKRILDHLTIQYGNDGYALLFRLREKMSLNGLHYIVFKDALDLPIMAREFHLEQDELKSMLDFLCEKKYIDKKLWEVKRVVWIQSYIDVIQSQYKRRGAKCITYEQIVEKFLKPKKRASLRAEFTFEDFLTLFNQITGQKRQLKGWRTKAGPKFKQLIKQNYTMADFKTVLNNVTRDEFLVKGNYITPYYVCKPDIFDKFHNVQSAEPKKVWQGKVGNGFNRR